MNPDEIIRGNLRLSWVDLGEGLSGDYDPDDPEDLAVLRVDAHERSNPSAEWEEWNEGSDYSFCTMFPVSATDSQRQDALKLLMDVAYPIYEKGESISRVLQRFSWIDLAVLDSEKSKREFKYSIKQGS